jgi:hypothetical protein
MGTVVAGITTSVDGYTTCPGDGPGVGLGQGGERLHYGVFGGPWAYDSPSRGDPTGVDRDWLDETMGANGAVVAGRGLFEADGERQVHIMGSAQIIRQALVAGLVDELTIILTPVVLGAGKRLLDGFTELVDLERLGVRQSPFATFIHYRVKR